VCEGDFTTLVATRRQGEHHVLTTRVCGGDCTTLVATRRQGEHHVLTTRIELAVWWSTTLRPCSALVTAIFAGIEPCLLPLDPCNLLLPTSKPHVVASASG
jgi:hypothetical protein